MFGNLGFPELLIIMVVILLLFGAKRIAGSMGKGIREFKKNINDATREVTSETHSGIEPESQSRLTAAELERRRAADEASAERQPPKRLL